MTSKSNTILRHILNEIRKSSLSSRSHSKKVISWIEDHRLRSKSAKALVFILPTRGCSWALSGSGGCSFCGYLYDNPKQTNFDEMTDQFKLILKEKLTDDQILSVKLFTSGSILDPKEVPEHVLLTLMEELALYSQIQEVVLESRPEYVNKDILNKIFQFLDPSVVEIAIGLESANNKILRDSINKGFFWEDFAQASSTVLSSGANIKTYLIFKPLFISEYDSIIDSFTSVKKIVELGIDTISINSISIHRGTLLSTLFEEEKYRPPWLWSLFHVCRELKHAHPDLRIICEPIAAGKERGAHNCGTCDRLVSEALKNFTLSQKVEYLMQPISCSCKNEWKSYLFHQKVSKTEIKPLKPQ